MKRQIYGLMCGLAATGVTVADVAPSGVVSEPMTLDIESGVRTEETVWALAYDTLWQGVTNADYRILVNGAVLATGSGAGTVAWHPTKYGTYALTYQAFVDNVKVGEDMSATFTLAGKDLVNAEITLAADEVLYDGAARCPKVTIVYQSETLVEGKDYTLEYENNVNPGVATMTIRGKGRFSDVLEKNFTIRPAGICSLDIESGTRVARPTELLTYDVSWESTNAVSEAVVSVNGMLLSSADDAGTVRWIPRTTGTHILSHTIKVDGVAQGEPLTATFVVKAVDPIPDLGEEATEKEVVAVIAGSGDARLLSHVTNGVQYTAYRAWALAAQRAEGGLAGTQAVRDSQHSWLSYALDSPTLLEKEPVQGELKIVGFGASAVTAACEVLVTIEGVTVGTGATAENLKRIFAFEGSQTLDEEFFSTGNVALEFGTPVDGKVTCTATPGDVSWPTFFLRVKMLQ